jgi:hypothetical protein
MMFEHPALLIIGIVIVIVAARVWIFRRERVMTKIDIHKEIRERLKRPEPQFSVDATPEHFMTP